MPDLEFRVRKARDDARVVQLAGFIDAATIQTLEELLARLVAGPPRRIVFDFDEVGYINSMGIAALINFREDVVAKGGSVAIARADREVAVTMENLGLTALIPLFGRISSALLGEQLDHEEVKREVRRAKPRARPSNGDRAAAIMVAPRMNHFTDVCQMRLGHSASTIELVHTIDDARRRMKDDGYGLLILEDRLPGAEQLLSDVKGSVRGGLMSVLKLYPTGTDLGRYDDWKIWENDYLVEPFEVRELFVMAERELARVPRDARETMQETRFKFRSNPANLARAITLLEALVASSNFDEHSAIKLLSALKEGMDNAMRHGNQGDSAKSVEVIYVQRKDRAEVHIIDEGEGFNWSEYLERAQGGDAYQLARDNRKAGKRGGLGIKIMFECCDRMRYHGNGNHLELQKSL